MDLARELDIARSAALLAGEAVLRARQSMEAMPDAPADITTRADLQAQEMILEFLAEEFPNDAYIAEENTITLGEFSHEGERCWIIDPIDGTAGFARMTDEFCIMIGLAVDHHAVLGVLCEPTRDRIMWAAKGGGCFERRPAGLGAERVVCVSGVSDLALARAAVSRLEEARHAGQMLRVGIAQCLPLHSCGVKLAMVARGEIDVYAEPTTAFSDWDICAAEPLIVEAGGQITDALGRPLQYGLPGNAQSEGIIASNGLLHTDLIARL